MSRGPIVLYEDSGDPKEFGLHDLICALAATGDQAVRNIRRHVECRPLNGNSQLLSACRMADKIARAGEPVVAVFDSDKVHALLRRTPDTADDDVIRAIKGPNPYDNLHVFLLNRNLESVLAAVEQCDESIDRKILRRARDKDINARDIVLKRIAMNPVLASVRDCVGTKVPSLKAIADWLAPHLAVLPT